MNKPKTRINKRWLFSLIAVAVLSSLATSKIIEAVNPTSTLTLSGGTYPGAPSYTVWVESGTYYAKDANGAIDFSGTNASLVMENVVDALPDSGGNIFFAGGVYGEDGQYIDIEKDGVHLIGEGSTFSPYGEGSTFSPAKMPTTTFRFRLSFLGVSGGGIYNVGIVPEADRHLLGEAAVLVQASHYINVEYVSIARFDTGILVTTANSVNSYSSHTFILNPMILNCTYGIILTKNGLGNKAEVTQIFGGGIYGLNASNKVTVGVDILISDFSTVSGTMFVNCVTGVKVDTGSNEGTHLSSLNFEGVTTPYDIGTALTDFSVYPMIPYFENWGQASKANNEWVAHGMLGEADHVFISEASVENVYLVGLNATHFQVGVSSGTVTFDWHTIYEP